MENSAHQGPQYNLTEMAYSLHAKFPERTYKEFYTYLNAVFLDIIPRKMHEGTPVIIQGFGTFYKIEDQVFGNPATEDPGDRIIKTKVHFRPAELLDILADKDTIKK